MAEIFDGLRQDMVDRGYTGERGYSLLPVMLGMLIVLGTAAYSAAYAYDQSEINDNIARTGEWFKEHKITLRPSQN